MPTHEEWIQHLETLARRERGAHPRVDPLTIREFYARANDGTMTGHDHPRVGLAEIDEVRYWTRLFAVTPRKLREAVRAVGNSVEKVREFLKR